jgi:hypothetical protein
MQQTDLVPVRNGAVVRLRLVRSRAQVSVLAESNPVFRRSGHFVCSGVSDQSKALYTHPRFPAMVFRNHEAGGRAMRRRKPTRVQLRRTRWEQLIARQADSGLSQRVFCEENGLRLTTFSKWKRRLSESTAMTSVEPPWLDLSALSSATRGSGDWDVELDLGAGVCLRLRRRWCCCHLFRFGSGCIYRRPTCANRMMVCRAPPLSG